MDGSYNTVNGRKVETLCCDRTKQFAIRIYPSDDCPFTESLLLPAMETAEYLDAKAAGFEYCQNLHKRLFDWHYKEVLVNGDVNDLKHATPLGFGLRADWTGIGDECGIVEAEQAQPALSARRNTKEQQQ